ncbi:unnamed protein product [Diatraea saccharalis]|uniref:Transcription termination factor 5, mitochondrial n=1 Tax=Diatraea saccharalis TaxID=40085 RepID=A0A9N9QTL9_9NEOP|nr:unnamed protein product [Diatraea saccharalis]
MEYCIKVLTILKTRIEYKYPLVSIVRHYHRIPFLDFYYKTTGEELSETYLPVLKKKHPNIESLTNEEIQCTLNILKKFDITPHEACKNLHIFSMNPIAVDNYGEILKECGFINIIPQYIIRYHTLVRSKTIKFLKKEGLMRNDIILEEALLNQFPEWPPDNKYLDKFHDSNTSILTVRKSVLNKYLHWKLSTSTEEFEKYCRHYLTLKHKPMSDIREALDIAQNDIKFNIDVIRRNGFIISTDPTKTKMLLENVTTLAGLNIREAIKIEPAILRNHYKSVLHVRNILEEYRISEKAQQHCLKIYCMKPSTVQQRLDELKTLKEYQVLSTNPRALSMVVHKNKMMLRLKKIQDARKQCYSFNNLVASNTVFKNYISGFGNKVCGRDIATLIVSYANSEDSSSKSKDTELLKSVLKQLKRHKYYLHATLSVVDETIQFLKKRFDSDVIFNQCQLLLYPVSEIEVYLNHLLELRNGGENKLKHDIRLDATYNYLKYQQLTDDQILSLVLYEIEKKYHFSGDGIWARQDGMKAESVAAS